MIVISYEFINYGNIFFFSLSNIIILYSEFNIVT